MEVVEEEEERERKMCKRRRRRNKRRRRQRNMGVVEEEEGEDKVVEVREEVRDERRCINPCYDIRVFGRVRRPGNGKRDREEGDPDERVPGNRAGCRGGKGDRKTCGEKDRTGREKRGKGKGKQEDDTRVKTTPGPDAPLNIIKRFHCHFFLELRMRIQSTSS